MIGISGALSLLRFALTASAMAVGVSNSYEAATYCLMAAWLFTVLDHTVWGKWGAAATEQGPGRIREERPWMLASMSVTFTLAYGSGAIAIPALSRTYGSIIPLLYVIVLCALVACGVWWTNIEPEFVTVVPKVFGLLLLAIVAVGSFEWTIYQSHGARFAILMLVAIAVLAVIHRYKLVTLFNGDYRYEWLFSRISD